MSNPAIQAARTWLARVIAMYEGIDAGPGDPVHATREKARTLLEAGPTEQDPFTIAVEVAAALPGYTHAAALAETWRQELERLDTPSHVRLAAEILGRLRAAADAFVTTHDQEGAAVRGLTLNDLAGATGESAARIADRIKALEDDGRVVESAAYPDLWMLPADEA